MKMLLQSNSWDCLPTAFAMCTDSLPRDIYDYIGHDGSQIIWPKLNDPYRRRSFHIDEMIDYCLSLAYTPVPITYNPEYAPFNADPFRPYINERSKERFIKYLKMQDAVLLGQTPKGKLHAVAWSRVDQRILDPEGFTYQLAEFNVHDAYLII